MSYFVYILRTSANTLYTGQTNNIERRLKQHKVGKGAKYMRLFSSFTLVHLEEFNTRSEAMKREREVKNLSKSKKEALVKHRVQDI